MIMAQHTRMEHEDENFFTIPKKEFVKVAVDEVGRFRNEEPLQFFKKLRVLPDDYLFDASSEEGYTPYYAIVPCNEAVTGMESCPVEIHYKDKEHVIIYTVL
jgi:hypothetical protein